MRNKKNFTYKIYQLGLLLMLLVLPNLVSAQRASVKATIDSMQIWIGDQTKLHFEVIQNKDLAVQFPAFTDTIVGGLEIVEQDKIDTVDLDNNQIQLKLSYVVTSFEDSLIYIPAFPFVLGDDTVWSNSAALRVIQPFEIDTASNAITDIKQVFNAKFDWKYYAKRILIVLLILLLLIVLFYFIRKYIKSKPVTEKPVELPKVPIIPAYVEALNQLAELDVKNYWQQGQTKLYHTELTEILRIYIDKVASVNGMEMTSEEILNALYVLDELDQEETRALSQVLRLADLVKFAKWNPAPIDNEMSMKNAIKFVELTKQLDKNNNQTSDSGKH